MNRTNRKNSRLILFLVVLALAFAPFIGLLIAAMR